MSCYCSLIFFISLTLSLHRLASSVLPIFLYVKPRLFQASRYPGSSYSAFTKHRIATGYLPFWKNSFPMFFQYSGDFLSMSNMEVFSLVSVKPCSAFPRVNPRSVGRYTVQGVITRLVVFPTAP